MTFHSDLYLKARPYQKKAIDDVRSLFSSKKKRILIQLATGAGKTYVFSTILQSAHKKGTPSIMVVRGRALVDQASRRLAEHNIPHSVFMSGDSRYNKDALIQIVSVDTCNAREEYPPAELVVIDEAHTALSESFKKFLSNYPNAFWLPVTATPWVKDGMLEIAEEVVYPVSMRELVEQGFLVPPKIFIASTFDTSSLKMSAGDYTDATSIAAFDQQGIYGDVVENYRDNCRNDYTWVFAVNIDHATKLSNSFSAAGFDNVVITGETPIDQRTQLLENNKLVISIGTLTTGVDLPKLKNLIICRPTRSRNLYVQMLGRGTRPYPGKEFFNVYDHVGNYREFGNILDETKADLLPVPKPPARSKLDSAPVLKACPGCKVGLPPATRNCPECGHVFEVKSMRVYKNDVMIEVKDADQATFAEIAMNHFDRVMRRGSKPGAAWYKLLEIYGEAYVQKNSKTYWQLYNKYKKIYDDNLRRSHGDFI